MKDDSILIIRHVTGDFISSNIEKAGFHIEKAYKNSNFILYAIWKFLKKYNLPGQAFWYNSNLKNLQPKTILLIDSMISIDFIKWIKKTHPDSRIIFWYWNIVQNSINPKYLPESLVEKWSFSDYDCKKYNLKFNPPFFFNNLKLEEMSKEYDLYFAGKNKGRLEELIKFKNLAEKNGVSTYLHVSPTKRIDLLFNKSGLKPPINYAKVLEGVSKSKGLLDIIEITDSGQSQRAMESIFFEKKLVTNSRLIKNYDFYNPKNIFVIGSDNINNLSQFINSPYEKVSEEIVGRYDVKQWVKRFLE